MNCPQCGSTMLIKEVYDFARNKEIKIAVCNNFKSCCFDDEIEIKEEKKGENK